MARNFFILVIFLPLWLSVPAIEVNGQQASGAAACTANPWIDVRCFGAAGNDVNDDTAAIAGAVAAALNANEPLLLPPGTYRTTQTLTIDYTTRATVGFRLISMGAVIDGTSISSQPVLEILCSGGNPHAPKGCFYFSEQGTLFVNGNTQGYAAVIGQPDFSDAHNSIKIDHLMVNNANGGSGAGGLQLNYVLSSQIFAVADSAGGAAGIALEQTQITHIAGAGSASASSGTGLLIENGYSFANTIESVDLEEAPTCLMITSLNAAHNTFISPYMNCATAVNVSSGNTTQLINPLFAGKVITQFAARVGVTTNP
jgi:Pectate lyase superfamily protein